jgi:hypothetical protein
LIPAPINDLRLQGFSFGGRFFVETQQVFGSIKVVENFDRLGKTLEDATTVKLDWTQGGFTGNLTMFAVCVLRDFPGV